MWHGTKVIRKLLNEELMQTLGRALLSFAGGFTGLPPCGFFSRFLCFGEFLVRGSIRRKDFRINFAGGVVDLLLFSLKAGFSWGVLGRKVRRS